MAVTVCFLGHSHSAKYLTIAAKSKGCLMAEARYADLVFVSADPITHEDGTRETGHIAELCRRVEDCPGVKILTSAVPVGFTRSLGIDIFYQPEILRMKDALTRAKNPDAIIIGYWAETFSLPPKYLQYVALFKCPRLLMLWEEAEFTKMAINVSLASQVDNTNRLYSAAQIAGVRWAPVALGLAADKRIGKKAYLKPGRWQDSLHLRRDQRALEDLECTARTS